MDQTARPLPPPGSAPASELPPPTLPPHAGVVEPTDGPPTPPSPATPPTPTFGPCDSVQPGELPRSSRTALMLTLGVVAIVALVAAGFFVLAGDDDAVGTDTDSVATPTEAGAFSFSSATTTVDASPGLRMEMTVVAPEGDIEMRALFDRRERRMSMEFSGDVDGRTVGDVRMIADEPAAMMYVSGAMFGSTVPWVGVDVSAFGDVMSNDWFEDPADMTDVFVGTEPIDLGVETIDGESLKHYEVTVSIDDVLAYDPSSLDGFGTADLTALESLTFDVWVDAPGHLRRMTFEQDLLGQSVALDMRLEHIDGPIAIPIPDPADVTGIDELIGSGIEGLGD